MACQSLTFFGSLQKSFWEDLSSHTVCVPLGKVQILLKAQELEIERGLKVAEVIQTTNPTKTNLIKVQTIRSELNSVEK